MQLLLHHFNLPLKHPFTISRRSFDHQENLVVELKDETGISGIGEATFNPYYTHTEISIMRDKLESLRQLIENYPLENPADFWKELHPHLANYSFAHCALDVAAHDYCAKKAGKPLHQQWDHLIPPDKKNPQSWPVSSYTLGIDPVEIMITRIKENPWPIYKIKLGRNNDIEIIKKIRPHTNAELRVDINCAWTLEEAIEKSKALADLGVTFIEQPLPADDWEGMEKLYAQSPLPLFADEACQNEADVDRCPGHFHGINIKLMKCGGLTPALSLIRKAREKDLRVMVGCMTESTVGISALAHLLPLIDYVDMDGPLFLAKDIASGVKVSNCGALFPARNGTGARLLS